MYNTIIKQASNKSNSCQVCSFTGLMKISLGYLSSLFLVLVAIFCIYKQHFLRTSQQDFSRIRHLGIYLSIPKQGTSDRLIYSRK